MLSTLIPALMNLVVTAGHVLEVDRASRAMARNFVDLRHDGLRETSQLTGSAEAPGGGNDRAVLRLEAGPS